MKSSEFLNEAPAAIAPVNPTMTSRTIGAPELSADPVQNFKNGVTDAKEFYDLARKAGVPVTDAIPMAYAKGQATATGDIGSFVIAVTDKATGTAEKGLAQLQSTIKDYADLYAQFLPTSDYYKKNIAPNPQLKAQADEFIRTNLTPQQYAQSIQQAQTQLKAPRAAPTQASAAVPSNPASQPPVAATNETAELDRILRLSGMEFIAEGSTKSITVQRGDTLSRIAADNSTTVAAIVKLNNIANPDRIYPGDVIRIPDGQGDPGGRAKRQGQSFAPDIDSDTDTDSDNISRVERALLNMIARRESSDDYNAINYKARAALKKGTMQITGKPGHHPFEGQSGVTAAGRYQMLYNTWKTAAKLAGVDPADFSPENQDRAAIALAKNEYKRKFNRDLIADLQDPKRVAQAVQGATGPWSVKAGGPGFTTQHYVSALSDIQVA
jgi:LysM repeat protein